MRLAAEGAEVLRLLLAVIPFFKSTIQFCYQHLDADVQRENFLRFMNIELDYVSLVLMTPRDLSEEDCKDCVEALQSFLHSLESLLDDPILSAFYDDINGDRGRKGQRKRVKGKVHALLRRIVHSSSMSGDNEQKQALSKLRKLEECKKGKQWPPSKQRMLELKPSIRQLVESPIQREHNQRILRLVTACNERLKSLLEPKSPQVPAHHEQELTKRVKRKGPRYQARNLAQCLHRKLTAALSTCDQYHEASLRLTTYWVSEPSDEPIHFDMLFSPHSEHHQWQEGRVIVTDQANPVLPTFSFQEPVKNICELVRASRVNGTSLQLLVLNDQLWHIPPLPMELHSSGAQPTISLKDLLEAGYFRKQRDGVSTFSKRILAVILAHSLLQLGEGPWISSKLDSESVLFLFEPVSQKLLDVHRPYVCVSLHPGWYHLENGDGKVKELNQVEVNRHALFHHPHILALGILLLEIEAGKVMEPAREDCNPDTGLPNVNTAWTTARRMLEDPEICDNVYQDYRSVIAACLQSNKFLPVDETFDDQIFREKFYESIVAPLEEELMKGWPEFSFGGPSEHAAARSVHVVPSQSPHTLGNITPSTNAKEYQEHISENSEGSSTAVNLVALPTANGTGKSRSSVAVSSVRHKPHGEVVFFDDEILTGTTFEQSNKYAAEWFKLLDQFHKNHIFPLQLQSRRAVRIAILDTGLNGSDPIISSHWKQIKRIRCWVGAEPVDVYGPQNSSRSLLRGIAHDDYGHGTHTVALLVKVAPGAEIFVARVSRDRAAGKAENVALAIKWASEECEADIITMSFGYKSLKSEIQKAIKDAHYKDRIIFAAASNYGGNGGVAYPANQQSKVICVNASDGYGNKTGFNPWHKPEEVPFSTLGAGIELNGKDGIVYKSGTSFATPIAAGIAALILEYAMASPKLELDPEQEKRLFSCDGMRDLFDLMSKEIDGYKYVAPWNLWQERWSDTLVCEKIRACL